MRAYIRRACVPAVLISAVLLTGCSSAVTTEPKADASAPPVVEETSAEPSETPSSSAPAPKLGVGESGTFDVGKTDEYGENYKVTSKLEVTVVSAKYLTAAELDTSDPEQGQYAELTLTVKNVGKAPAKFSSYGMMQWEDEQTAAQDATTLEGVGDGPDLDTTYKPGQSVTGKIILDITRKGGTVSYVASDDPEAEGPVFTVTMPKS
ncbi:DUF4352 domain-containing protein [Streptomyces sp. NBC_00076]|uniref:DUF4352 domain-containing protein n=1 Tax=Streptomyces sp. NBC_00076 TaxID=2975642 RepID=UPI00324BD9DC